MNTSETQFNDMITLVRSTIRKDLNTVGIIPTGKGIELIASIRPQYLLALRLEAIYVQIFNNKGLEDLYDYLTGPMQIPEEELPYLINCAFRVRESLNQGKGSGKLALDILMKDKGAEVELMKLLLTICFNVSKEFNVPFGKKLKINSDLEEE